VRRDWTCSQARRLNTALTEAKKACRERAEREHRKDPYSRDAKLFEQLGDAFMMLESYHRH
jgi:hypothetical protein